MATSASMPGRDPGGVPADVAGAEHHDPGRPHAGRAAEQHAPAAVVLLQEVGPDLGRHPAGHLAHGGQERQRPGGQLHRLVGDAGHPAVEERLAHLRVGGQVEVGEEHLPFPHQAELGRLGLLHLADDLGPLPHLRGAGGDLGAGPDGTRRR